MVQKQRTYRHPQNSDTVKRSMAEVEMAAAKRHAVIGEDSTRLGAKKQVCYEAGGRGGGRQRSAHVQSRTLVWWHVIENTEARFLVVGLGIHPPPHQMPPASDFHRSVRFKSVWSTLPDGLGRRRGGRVKRSMRSGM